MFKDYRKNHPEMQEGEVLITNSDDEGYGCVGWKSKRKGKVTYDTSNKPLGHRWPDSFPVFAQRDELEEHGVDPDKIWKRRMPSFVSVVAIAVIVVIVLVAISTFVR